MPEISVDQRTMIISDEYADLIIDYRNSSYILQALPSATIHMINEAFAVLYIPVTEFSGESIVLYGYSATPSMYGLTSEVALEASGIDALRNIPTFNLRGSGVLFGIIDTGINYNLPFFKNADGTTRILSLWDQTIESDNYPIPEMFGTEYSREQINQAIASEDPLSVVPSTDVNGHGTMLAAVGAGTEVEVDNFYGVAPETEIVAVKLRPAKTYLKNFFVIPEEVECYQENSIMWGLQYCVDMARKLNRPISICLGVGTSQGAHDGQSPLSTFVSLLANFPRTGIVTSVGNEGNMGRHFHGVIDPEIGNITVELTVGENEVGFSMELWGSTPGIYSIDMLSPSGEYIPRITAGIRLRREIAFIFENTVIDIEYRTVESEAGDQLILLRFKNVSSGVWRFTVYAQGDLATDFHIWLPMGNMLSEETRFIQPDIYTTVLAPGASPTGITVTAYNPLNNTLYVNASRGYTRSNIIKPEFAAPGVNYAAPNQEGTIVTSTGTGIAAAHATGIAAMLLEWGVIRGNQPNLSTLEIKNYLIRGAQRSANLIYPNRDWGYGSIDVFNTFNVLRVDT